MKCDKCIQPCTKTINRIFLTRHLYPQNEDKWLLLLLIVHYLDQENQRKCICYVD